MIKGAEVGKRVAELLGEGLELEEVLYRVTRELVRHLPSHLQDDPQEISTVLGAVQYYAHEAHPEFQSNAKTHDLVLLRLVPKSKTERYIQQLNDESIDA